MPPSDILTCARKRCLAVHELVEEDTESPSVDRMVVRSLLNHLRGHILQCTTIGLSLTFIEVALSVTF